MAKAPAGNLETFPNPRPGRDYTIEFTIPEFTCLCPQYMRAENTRWAEVIRAARLK